MLDMWHRYGSQTMYLKATPSSKYSCCTICAFPSISSWTADISSELIFAQGLASPSPLKMSSELTFTQTGTDAMSGERSMDVLH